MIRDLEAVSKPGELDQGAEEEYATQLFWFELLRGVRVLADESTKPGLQNNAESIFRNVASLAVQPTEPSAALTFGGPHHLATLLASTARSLVDRRIINTSPPAPENTDWEAHLRAISRLRPFLWPNHLEAIDSGFLRKGTSAAVSFPTGAGKSTLVQLKIGSVLSLGRAAIYIVPTHALADQVSRDLRAVFDRSHFEPQLPSGIATILVSTPEACLSLLSANETLLMNTGVVVFDECHLLHPKEGSEDRRAVDAMIALMGLAGRAPDADLVLLSAMMQNAHEISRWLAELTGRQAIVLDSAWKPTRQARGCVMYPKVELDQLSVLAKERRGTKQGAQKKVGPVKPGIKDLHGIEATPWALFSLHQTWRSKESSDYSLVRLAGNRVPLALSQFWAVTSNRNDVSAALGADFIRCDLRTMILVQNTLHVDSLARKLAVRLGERYARGLSQEEAELRDSAVAELGGEQFLAAYAGNGVAAHHGFLLPVERRLSESLFSSGRAVAIVVSPTMAQGINMPADAVLIVGDDRFNAKTKKREALPPHELLNAAGRAGRAGNFSYGVVLVVPGEPVRFSEKDDSVGQRWFELRDQVFGKSDQCLDIADPIELWLDLLEGVGLPVGGLADLQLDFLSKLPVDANSGFEPTRKLLSRSFAAFRARTAGLSAEFERKLSHLLALRAGILSRQPTWIEAIASANGVRSRCVELIAEGLPKARARTVQDWVRWLFSVLRASDELLHLMLPPSVSGVAKLKSEATGWAPQKLDRVEAACLGWMDGATLLELERVLQPNRNDYTSIKCAREFVVRELHHLSFGLGLVARIWERAVSELNWQPIPLSLRLAASCVREGFDSAEMLAVARLSRTRMTRLQVRSAASQRGGGDPEVHSWLAKFGRSLSALGLYA